MTTENTNTGSRKEFCEKVLQTIETLGNTAGEVADKLKENHIIGVRRRHNNCPLVNYLKTKFDTKYAYATPNYIEVNGCRLFRADCSYRLADGDHKLQNTTIFDFIRDFDEGFYPYLEKQDEHNDY